MSLEQYSVPYTFRHMTIGAGVRAAAARDPHKVAITHDQRSIRYAELVRRMDLITNATIADLKLQPGQNAAIVSKNCIEYIEITCGVPEAGVPVATINPRMSPAEIVAVCDDAQAQVVFVDAANAAEMRKATFKTVKRIIEFGPEYETWLQMGNVQVTRPTINEWDTWTMPYTSGTTGQPKGVLISHRSRMLVFLGGAGEFGCFTPEDKYLAMTPMAHGGGIAFAINALVFGGTVDVMDKFDAEKVLRKFKFEGVTGVFMVPTHFHAIFELPKAVLGECYRPPIKTIIANAAPLPQAMKEKIVPYFGDTVLHEIYSSTEAGLVTDLRPKDQLRKIRCVGLPMVNTRVKILDEDGKECGPGEVGELCSSSPYFFSGYWNRPEETKAAFRDGWVCVGDMAKTDDEGYIYIVDRKKDMVISGGVNIYPREVEEVLFQHPAVADVAVVGVADEKWGERLKAFVVLRAGHSFNVDDMAAFCSGKLGSYKTPKDMAILAELPRNANGKVLKRELRLAS